MLTDDPQAKVLDILVDLERMIKNVDPPELRAFLHQSVSRIGLIRSLLHEIHRRGLEAGAPVELALAQEIDQGPDLTGGIVMAGGGGVEARALRSPRTT